MTDINNNYDHNIATAVAGAYALGLLSDNLQANANYNALRQGFMAQGMPVEFAENFANFQTQINDRLSRIQALQNPGAPWGPIIFGVFAVVFLIGGDWQGFFVCAGISAFWAAASHENRTKELTQLQENAVEASVTCGTCGYTTARYDNVSGVWNDFCSHVDRGLCGPRRVIDIPQ